MLLPFETPTGRRVEYLREPIPDHGVPADRETMDRILAMLDGALETGHCVYLHCRAGIGRSAMAAGCWLAERNPAVARRRSTNSRDYWQQCGAIAVVAAGAGNREQDEFVRTLAAAAAQPRQARRGSGATGAAGAARPCAGAARARRLVRPRAGRRARRDARSRAQRRPRRSPGRSTRRSRSAWPRACTRSAAAMRATRSSVTGAGSRTGTCRPRASPAKRHASPDVAKALATYRWRGLPMAGSHDPKDARGDEPAARAGRRAVRGQRSRAADRSSRAECSRTTHQSPLILDACRVLRGDAASAHCSGQPPQDWLQAVPEPVPRLLGARPLRKDVQAAVTAAPAAADAKAIGGTVDVLQALAVARRIVLRRAGLRGGHRRRHERSVRDDAALVGGLVGTMFGLRTVFDALARGRARRGSRAASSSTRAAAALPRAPGADGRSDGVKPRRRRGASRRGRGSTTKRCSTCASATCGCRSRSSGLDDGRAAPVRGTAAQGHPLPAARLAVRGMVLAGRHSRASPFRSTWRTRGCSASSGASCTRSRAATTSG